MPPRVRIAIGIAAILLLPCARLADSRARGLRGDGGTVAAELRVLAWQSAMWSALAALFSGITASIACRKSGLHWRAHRFRHHNLYWCLAIPLWLLPLLVGVLLAPQLYGDIDENGNAYLLARGCDRALSVATFAPIAFLSTCYALVLWRESAKGDHRCDACGYDLTGATSDRCPECGHPISWRVPWPRGDP